MSFSRSASVISETSISRSRSRSAALARPPPAFNQRANSPAVICLRVGTRSPREFASRRASTFTDVVFLNISLCKSSSFSSMRTSSLKTEKAGRFSTCSLETRPRTALVSRMAYARRPKPRERSANPSSSTPLPNAPAFKPPSARRPPRTAPPNRASISRWNSIVVAYASPACKNNASIKGLVKVA